MRTFCIVVVLALFVLVAELFLLVSPWLAGLWFVLLTTLFFVEGLKLIPANPPHKGILTFCGKRQEVALNEGLNFFPLWPLFNFILIKVEKINYDLEPQEVRTPDKAMISVMASLTFTPGIEDTPGSFITYLNSGGPEGVKKIIHDTIEDRVKTWAASNREGPSTWMEALALKDDAHEVLVKLILGNILEEVGDPIPTNTWMRFLDKPQSEPTQYDAIRHNGKKWATKNPDGSWNWDGLQDIFDAYTDRYKAELEAKIRRRRKAVRKIREGKGEFGDESLGITIVRFTVNEIEVTGKVAEAAEQAEKESREQDADKVEITNVSNRIAELRARHPDMSVEQAIRLVQVERGKATQTNVNIGGASTALGADLLGAIGVNRVPSQGP